jgi:hypothetical protein
MPARAAQARTAGGYTGCARATVRRGVDVGLLGMREYSLDGKQDVFDDGIPAEWKMPATPMNWYKPRQRDYYDVEAQGVAPYKPYLLPLFEPDHQPKIN